MCVKARCVGTLKRDFLKSDDVILKSTSRKTFYQEFGLETLERKILLEALLLIQIMQKSTPKALIQLQLTISTNN